MGKSEYESPNTEEALELGNEFDDFFVKMFEFWFELDVLTWFSRQIVKFWLRFRRRQLLANKDVLENLGDDKILSDFELLFELFWPRWDPHDFRALKISILIYWILSLWIQKFNFTKLVIFGTQLREKTTFGTNLFCDLSISQEIFVNWTFYSSNL